MERDPVEQVIAIIPPVLVVGGADKAHMNKGGSDSAPTTIRDTQAYPKTDITEN